MISLGVFLPKIIILLITINQKKINKINNKIHWLFLGGIGSYYAVENCESVSNY